MASTQYFYYPNLSVKINGSTIKGVQNASFSKEAIYRSAYSNQDEAIKPTKVVIDGPSRYTANFTCLDIEGAGLPTFISNNFAEGLIEANNSALSINISNGTIGSTIEQGFITNVSYQIGANEYPTLSYTITGPKGSFGGGGTNESFSQTAFDDSLTKLPRKMSLGGILASQKIKSISASFSREIFFVYNEGKIQPRAVFLSDRDKIQCMIESYTNINIPDASSTIELTFGRCSLKNLRLISKEQNLGLNDVATSFYKLEGAKDATFSV